jgi:cytochrome b involved in lipid metabolism
MRRNINRNITFPSRNADEIYVTRQPLQTYEQKEKVTLKYSVKNLQFTSIEDHITPIYNTPITPVPFPEKIVTQQELKSHFRTNDCLIVYDRNVYDISSYSNIEENKNNFINICGTTQISNSMFDSIPSPIFKGKYTGGIVNKRVIYDYDIIKHSTVDNCWIVYENNVYNISSHSNKEVNRNTFKDLCGKEENISANIFNTNINDAIPLGKYI